MFAMQSEEKNSFPCFLHIRSLPCQFCDVLMLSLLQLLVYETFWNGYIVKIVIMYPCIELLYKISFDFSKDSISLEMYFRMGTEAFTNETITVGESTSPP